MRHKGRMLIAVLTLFLGFAAPVWATHTVDPMEEEYSTHVLPYYNSGQGFLSFVILSDTSYKDSAFVSNNVNGVGACNPGRDTPCSMLIHLYFFNQDCLLGGDDVVSITTNGAKVYLVKPGFPTEGVIFADTGLFQGGEIPSQGGFQRFLTYVVVLNVTDNTLTRIDSIPFSPFVETDFAGTFVPIGTPLFSPGPRGPDLPVSAALAPFTIFTSGHWTRYDPINTTAATFGDGTAQGFPEIRTTLTFFNALGGGVSGAPNFTPIIIGTPDTLREFMLFYGRPRSPFGATGGDWVTKGLSGVSDITATSIVVDAFLDEAPVASIPVLLKCFTRVRLKDLLPPPTALLTAVSPPGHLVAFSLVDGQRTSATSCGPTGRCSFSGFQETTVVSQRGNMIFSGYMHHSHAQNNLFSPPALNH